MGLLLLLLFTCATYALAPASNGEYKAHCGPLDWFQYNLRHSVYQPFLDGFTYLLYSPPNQLANRKQWDLKLPLDPPPPIRSDRSDGYLVQSCESVGIYSGLDVLNVLFKIYSGGYELPPLIGMSPILYSQLYLFDICTVHISIHDFDEQRLAERPHVSAYMHECERATRIFHCAAFNIATVWPWLIGLALICITCLTVPVGGVIWWCMSG